MIERKSSRARKSVDYAKFGADEDSDDDFKESTPPVAKRQKVTNNKENTTKQADKPAPSSKDPKPKKQRASIDEKLYEREMQKALELSLSQSDGSQENVTKETENTTLPVLTEEEKTDSGPVSPLLPKIDPPVLTKVVDTEVIEVLATGINVEDNQGNIPSRRKVPAKQRYVDSDSDGTEPDFEVDLRRFLRSPMPKVSKKDDDSDFEVGKDVDELSDESDEDFNADDSDSDFGVSNNKKKKKATPKSTSTPKQGKSGNSNISKAKSEKTGTTNAIKSNTIIGSSKTATIVTTTPAVNKTALHKSPAPSKSVSSVKTQKTPTAGPKTPTASLSARKTPNWTPPALSSTSKSPLDGASLKSPSTGLRIGLSRNMKLKPLHPNLKLHN